MAIEIWNRTVSARKPCKFDSALGMLELRACILPHGGQSSRLVCKVEGSSPLTLANLPASEPCHRVKALFEDSVEFSCTGGDVLISGVLLPIDPRRGSKRSAPAASAEVLPEEAPAPKAARREVPAAPAAKKAIAKMAPSKPSASSPVSSPANKPPNSPANKPASPRAVSPANSPANKPAPVPLTAGELEALHKVAAALPVNGSKKDKKKPPVAHRVLRSGLAYDVLKLGDTAGKMATRAATVTVRYEGWLRQTDKCFDKGELKFRLGIGEVIRGWDEGLEGMLLGETRRLYVPSRLGYGVEGSGKAIPPHSDLIFEVEYLQ